MKKDFMFTSESVTEGHPDKLCDQISDAIVDHFLMQDPRAGLRIECAVSSAIVFIAGRFATRGKVDLTHVARKVIKRIGYDQPDFNSKICSILSSPQGSPPDRYFDFDEHRLTDDQIEKLAVKTQATLFGFACDHTPELMPLPISLARRLSMQLSRARVEGKLSYLMPDGKVQVGVEFLDRKPVRIHSITITASQRDARHPDLKTLEEDIRRDVIDSAFQDQQIRPDPKTRIFVNPDGLFLGGPSYHSGLTGRKNGVDTYGEYSRHSGNALSGKDPSRIDKVGAYAARYAAKNIVAAGLASECEITLSYSIGITRPVSLQVETSGTGKLPDPEIREMVKRHFDFRLAAILRDFNLRNLPASSAGGFYQRLAAYGHFGRTDMELPWERTDKASALR
ncbi:MAG: methionine adenosyltransferase [Desulfobacteraceae bacterium]|jgi:S-adenosylmethionine synthetase|nr:MAG: methionine adenosyltransferase [Desulfobacteraceae bacterium]